MELASDSESESGSESEHEMACGPLLAAAFEPIEQTFDLNRDHLAADVKQSLLALDDETAAACVQALAAAMHAGNLNGDGDAWLRERIAEANAAPAGARSYCSVA